MLAAWSWGVYSCGRNFKAASIEASKSWVSWLQGWRLLTEGSWAVYSGNTRAWCSTTTGCPAFQEWISEFMLFYDELDARFTMIHQSIWAILAIHSFTVYFTKPVQYFAFWQLVMVWWDKASRLQEVEQRAGTCIPQLLQLGCNAWSRAWSEAEIGKVQCSI